MSGSSTPPRHLITAEYEELPAVFDEIEALTSDVYVHDELRPAASFADLKHLKGVKNTNVALTYKLRRGDFDTAYAAAPHKFEHEFRTQKALHRALMSMISSSRLTVKWLWSPSIR